MIHKKSQTEIIGLLIIVIIISLILLLVIKNMSGPSSSPKTEYMNKDLASSLVGAILNMDSGCKDNTIMSKIIIDCAKNPENNGNEIICGPDTSPNTCEFAHNKIEMILNKTLKKWNKDYEFKVLLASGSHTTDTSLPQGYQSVNYVPKLHFTSDNLKTGNPVTYSQPLPIDSSGKIIQVMVCIGGKCIIK